MKKKQKAYEITIKNTADALAMPFAIKINVLSISIFVLFVLLIFGLGGLAAFKYFESRQDIALLDQSLNQKQSMIEAEAQRISSLSTNISTLESSLNDATSTINGYQNVITGLETENSSLSMRMSSSYQTMLEQQIDQLKARIKNLSGIAFASGSTHNGVMLLDWFNGGRSAFVKHVPVQVVDVETGISFNAERFGGTYHADCQPLTKNDTAFFKSIVGEWTWNRRPIWVKINGTYYAASMNCMPHMVSPDNTNDFPGHFCIHFFHSLVHETDAECPRHQTCVMYAFINADKR